MSIKYRKFETKEDADQWVEEYKAYFPKMSDSDTDFLQAIYFYTASANVPINRHLREDNTLLDEDDTTLFPMLHSMLVKLPYYHIPDNIIVFRYINKGLLKQMCPNWPLRKGMIISDKSFLSTTLLRHGVDDYLEERNAKVLLEIAIPAGTRGTYVGLADTMPEYEVILVPNVKLRIDNICFPFQKKYKCTVINC